MMNVQIKDNLREWRGLSLLSILLPLLMLGKLEAQQKVDSASEDPVMGSQNSYYSTNFINGQAWGQGNSGVVTQHGAAALFVNPANMIGESKFDIFLEGVVFRNRLYYGEIFSGNDTYAYKQPKLRFNALAGVLHLNDRLAVGVAISQRRQYLLEIQDTLVEVAYEQINGPRTFYLEVKADLHVYDLSLAMAAVPVEKLNIGIGMSFLRHDAFYAEVYANAPHVPPTTLLDDIYNAWVTSLGVSYELGPFRSAVTFRTSDRFATSHHHAYDNKTTPYSVHIPAQFAAGLNYRDLLNFEYRHINRSTDYLRTAISEYGGGIHLPLGWVAKNAPGHLNAGLFRRDSDWSFGFGGSQYFVSLGAELPFRDLELFATLINGHLLTKGEGEISELLCGIGYRLSRW